MRNRDELLRQIAAYKLDDKLKALAEHDEKHRPFRHLPKQFSKGILIGNIAIVPRRADETRFVYVIADMIQARIVYEDIFLKQSAILIAHYLADGKSMPENILLWDSEFASRIFDIKSYKGKLRTAEKSGDDDQAFIYENKYREANRQADAIKQRIQDLFDTTFRTNTAK
jgi:hypothetical protein